MSTLTIILIALGSALSGALLGVGGTVAIQAAGDDDAPETVAAVAEPIAAAVREDVTDAETRQAVATSPAVNLAVVAAVKPDAAPHAVALAALALTSAAAQGKEEGASAFQVRDMAALLARTVDAMPACECPAPLPVAEP